MQVRRYRPGEETALWILLYNTVRKVNIRDYSQRQVEAWVPDGWDMGAWARRLEKTNPYVADRNGHLIGFAELEPTGRIDCFYCHWQWQRKGVGTALLDAVEREASARGVSRIHCEASITAKGFFIRNGFRLEEERTVSRRGERFVHFHLAKRLLHR